MDNARPISRETVLWCALIFAVAFVVRLIFLETPCHTDNTDYLHVAAAYSADSLDTDSPVSFRLGMLVPLMLLEGVFGGNMLLKGNCNFFLAFT